MNPTEIVSSIADISESKARVFLGILMGYPMAFIFRQLISVTDSKLVQNLFSSLGGFIIMYYVFDTNIWHSLVDIITVYGILYLFGGTKFSLFLTWIVTMSHLLYGYAVIYYSGVLYPYNWAIPQCVMVLKLIDLATSLYDGGRKETLLTEEQKKFQIKELPSFIEFFGYCYFFCTILVGPVFPFRRYQMFVSGTLYDRNITPSSVPASLLRFVYFLIAIAIFIVFSHYFPLQYVITEEFINSSLLYRLAVMIPTATGAIHSLLCVWILAESSSILTGITYDGVKPDGAVDWGGLCNAKLILFNFGITIQSATRSNNLRTTEWVARNIYKRLKWMGNQYLSIFIATMFLCIWHGFWVGYFLFFFGEFILVPAEKLFISYSKQLIGGDINQLSWAVYIPVWLFAFTLKNLVMSFAIICFFLLSWEACFKLGSSLYFYPHVIGVGWIAVYQILPKKKKAID